MFCPKCGRPIPNGGVCPCQQGQPSSAPIITDNSRLYSILAYVGFLWIIGLLAAPEKDRVDVRFHVGQGMILFIVCMGLSIVLSILSALFSWILIIGTIISILLGVIQFSVGVLYIVLMILGIINASGGKLIPLPLVGSFAFYK